MRSPPQTKDKMAKHKNNLVHAAQVTSKGQVLDGAQEKDNFDHKSYLGMAFQIAESEVYCGNWKFKNADKHFPYNPLLRTVDRYFPYAKGGPLFLDLVQTKNEEQGCKLKAAAMKYEGQRYVYITAEMTLQDAIDQLEGKE